MVEVTQEDRRSAGQIFELLDAEQLSTSNVQNILARHRIAAEQRGKLEGARLALESVLPEVVTDRTIDAHGAHCRCTTCELNIAEDTIRALDPAKIVGEG